MTTAKPTITPPAVQTARTLLRLYAVRVIFSLIWVAAMFLVGIPTPGIGMLLLVIYPAWDAVATFIDIQANRGARSQTLQYVNLGISILTTLALALALSSGISAMIVVFGVWALLAGLIQLAVALYRRRELGGQWPMILSGAQSGLAGVSFILMAGSPMVGLSSLAGYSAFGAFYFLLAAIRLFQQTR